MVRRNERERSGLGSVVRADVSFLALSLLVACLFVGADALRPSAAVAANDSQFVSQTVPTVMVAGQSYQVSVRFRNSGSTTWNSGYFLGSQNPHDNFNWGTNRVALPASVAPAAEQTVTFTVTAPVTPGTYNFQWRVLQEFVEWFGAPSPNVAVTVGAAGNASQFVTQSVPTVMNVGQTYSVSVRFRNSGTLTWGSGYFLGSQNPHDNRNWGTNRIALGASVAPGQERTVTFNVKAPSTPGEYNFQWRVVQEFVEWFGAVSTNVTVRVQVQGNHAQVISQSVPSIMEGGQSYAVTVRLRNSGSTTWGNDYFLGSQNPQDNFVWGMNRVAIGATVAPGQERSVTWTVTPPATPGVYNFQWRVLRESVAWFGDFSPNIPVQVTPVAPAVGGGFSLHFRGNAASTVDRVAVKLDAPAVPIDVGGDFTLEWWMKTATGNATGSCVTGADNWQLGNILLDRDVSGTADFGEYGVSLFGTGGHLAFGVNRLGTGQTICGATNVADGTWHHVAFVRESASGDMRLYVDGDLDAQGVGPTGDVSYRNGRTTSFPSTDPYLLIGGAKGGGASYHGWIDEVRVSDAARYDGSFTPAGPFQSDADTVALFHFDEDNGDTLFDESGASGGPSDGVRRYGGTPAGPDWSIDTPFAQQVNLVFDTLTSGLSGPSYVTDAGDDRLFITQLGGKVVIYDGDSILATAFLDITSKVGSQGQEQGLFSIAFHPSYANNGFFFVSYTDKTGHTVVERYHVSGNPNVADPSSGKILLQINQPNANHNGGQLQFGPDGFLYVGRGDGGGAGDPNCFAQSDSSLLGKMLRLDVDQNVNTPPYYGIPFDNPFVGPGDPPDIVWAEGLRNPWRYGFDRLTDALFIADVGQSTLEEVNYIPPHSAGALNFGWKIMEGTACFSSAGCAAGTPPCESPVFTRPIAVYGHANGNCSITGGYVYRGTLAPSLIGTYLYVDFCSGRMWMARQNEGQWTSKLLSSNVAFVQSFGEDVAGELYLVTSSGDLLRVHE